MKKEKIEDNITTIGGVTNLTKYFVTKTSVNIEEFLNEMKKREESTLTHTHTQEENVDNEWYDNILSNHHA